MIRKVACFLALTSSLAFAAPAGLEQEQTFVLMKILERQTETLEAIKAQNEILKEQNRMMKEQLFAVRALLVSSQPR